MQDVGGDRRLGRRDDWKCQETYKEVSGDKNDQNHKSEEYLGRGELFALCAKCVQSKALDIENSGKELHRKYKGWGHTQSQVRKIGNRLTSVKLMGRLEGSRNSPETQGSEQTGDDRYRD